MTHRTSYAIRGQRVGGGQSRESVEECPREPAPRREAAYHCDRACVRSPFTVPLAANVTPPATWDCRCGSVGRLNGAPGDASVDLPGYGQPSGRTKGVSPRDGMDPWGQLMKRRTRRELDDLLAERMAQVRQSGAAR